MEFSFRAVPCSRDDPFRSQCERKIGFRAYVRRDDYRLARGWKAYGKTKQRDSALGNRRSAGRGLRIAVERTKAFRRGQQAATEKATGLNAMDRPVGLLDSSFSQQTREAVMVMFRSSVPRGRSRRFLFHPVVEAVPELRCQITHRRKGSR